MEDKKKKLIEKIKKKKDKVGVASRESFPASDPPASWASAPVDQNEDTEEKEAE